MPAMSPDKFAKLISYSIGPRIPKKNRLLQVIERAGAQKKMVPLGAYFLRGLDMDGVIALTLPKQESNDNLDHYVFVWFSKEKVSVQNENAHASLQITSLSPPQFMLRGKPEAFVKVLGESSIIQGILVDLIDDLKCLERFTIYNKHGSQNDALVLVPPELIGTRFIVQTMVSEEPTLPPGGKVERMEIALPHLIDLANFSIMTGLKMFGPMKEFSNFCTHCGKKLPHGENKFCIHCGKPVVD